MTTALLVIDLQRGMFEGEQPPLEGDGVVARVAALLERARERGVAVLHIRHYGGTGDMLERGTPGWGIHPDVVPRGAEPVVDKTGAGRDAAGGGRDADRILCRFGVPRGAWARLRGHADQRRAHHL